MLKCFPPKVCLGLLGLWAREFLDCRSAPGMFIVNCVSPLSANSRPRVSSALSLVCSEGSESEVLGRLSLRNQKLI